MEESPEPAIPESPESPVNPAPEEDSQPSWISGYLRTPGGFEYHLAYLVNADLQAGVPGIQDIVQERVKAGLPEVEQREDVSPVTVTGPVKRSFRGLITACIFTVCKKFF